jgi:hypothetical protein
VSKVDSFFLIIRIELKIRRDCSARKIAFKAFSSDVRSFSAINCARSCNTVVASRRFFALLP